jgi:hypothetical protein
MIDEIKKIQNERKESYGDTKKSFQTIAAFWSTYLDIEINPEQVAVMMALLKVSRSKTDKSFDTYLDFASYAILTDKVREKSDKE